MSAVRQEGGAEALDAAYDNTRAVAESAALFDDFETRSAVIRTQPGARLDLRYGPAPRQRIDYFPALRPGPLLAFIQGGFWPLRTGEHFSFLAAGPLAHGIHVALIDHTPAPDKPLAGIVGEIREALRWLHGHAPAFGADVRRIVIGGWSAGAHLAAVCLDDETVYAGLAISGIYDLAPIRACHLNERLQLSVDDIEAYSPARHALSAKPLGLSVGQAELLSFQRQTFAFSRQRHHHPGGTLLLPGHHHFSILGELARPDGDIAQQLRTLAA